MIKVEHIEVFNWQGAIRGMRNPLNSWEKSDSGMKMQNYHDVELGYQPEYEFTIGENDLALMRKLCRAGSDHRKFLRQIMVSMDITAPLYWWKEFDTYKVGTVANSCSTMHTIHKKEFTLDDFSHEHLCELSLEDLQHIIDVLNRCRNLFLYGFKGVPGDDAHDVKPNEKKYWWQMIQLLPTSYNQKRTVTLNYEVLLNIYHARRNHKLDEWRTFCGYIETMPYFAEICLEGDNG